MTQAPLIAAIPEWTLGDRLRKARESAGFNQSEFETESGISRRSITNYETDVRSPRKPHLIAWAKCTNVPMQWLLTGSIGPGNGGRARPDSNGRPSDYSVASAISGRLVRLTHFRDRRTVPRLKPPTPDVEVTYPRAA